jgi:hypothetical protein
MESAAECERIKLSCEVDQTTIPYDPNHVGSHILYLSVPVPLVPAFYIYHSMFRLFLRLLFDNPSAAGSSACDASLY